MHHDGTINYYDIKFGQRVLKNVPARLVEVVKEVQHEHQERLER